MNNALFIVSKQLCSPIFSKHGIFNYVNAAGRQARTFHGSISSESLQRAENLSKPSRSLNFAGSCKDKGASPRHGRHFHAAPQVQKRNPASGGLPKSKSPSKIPPRLLERVKIPFGAISKKDLSNIFERDVDYVEGNNILRMLHERRVNGALVDKGVQPENETVIPAESLLKALEWLRKKYAVDEKHAAQRWAAMEAARLEAKYIADAERLGLYKPVDDSAKKSYSNTSTSAIEEFKSYNERKNVREAEELEKSGKAQESRELSLARQEEKAKKQVESAERVAQRRKERAVKGMVTNDDQIPEMTTAQRIVRPTIFGVLFLAFVGLASSLYTPVPQADRMFPTIPVAFATIGGIAAVNLFIFLLWRFPPAWRILNTYFTQVPAYPYALSVLGNTLSHRKFLHLVSNVAVGLFFFGIDIHEEVGRANFMELYLSGCISGSLFSLFYYVLTKNFVVYTQGASGGVFALMTAWAVMNAQKPPASTETHAFALDVSRWAVIGTTLLGHALPSVRFGLDWMSHIGGAIAGLSFVLTRRLLVATEPRQIDDRMPKAPSEPSSIVHNVSEKT